jgi:hypothetical protein
MNMAEEKIIGTKVIDEKVVEVQQKLNCGKSRLGIGLLAAMIGASGYGAHALQVNQGYIGKGTIERVAYHAVQKGYTTDVWKVFPEKDRILLIKGELKQMPSEKAWEMARPVAERESGRMYDPQTKDSRFMYNTLKKYLQGE